MAEHTYLTTQEVADLLRLSIKSVQRLSCMPDGPPCYLANRQQRLFPREDLERWLKNRPMHVQMGKRASK